MEREMIYTLREVRASCCDYPDNCRFERRPRHNLAVCSSKDLTQMSTVPGWLSGLAARPEAGGNEPKTALCSMHLMHRPR